MSTTVSYVTSLTCGSRFRADDTVHGQRYVVPISMRRAQTLTWCTGDDTKVIDLRKERSMVQVVISGAELKILKD